MSIIRNRRVNSSNSQGFEKLEDLDFRFEFGL